MTKPKEVKSWYLAGWVKCGYKRVSEYHVAWQCVVVVVGEQKLKEWSTNGSSVRMVARAKKKTLLRVVEDTPRHRQR